MRTIVLVAAAVVALSWIAAPAWAEAGDMRLRFGVLESFPSDELKEPGETIKLDDAVGFFVGFEYMVSDLIGVEPELSFANHDVKVTDAAVPDFDLGDIDYRALTGTVNFHVVAKEKWNLHLGPTVGYVFWGDLKTTFLGGSEEIGADGEFTYGANVGLGVPFGDRPWGFSAALTYLFSDLTLDGGSSDLGVDPIQVKLGISYEF